VPDFACEGYLSPREVRRASRATQLGVAAAADAVSDAGLVVPQESDRIGVMVGQAGATMLAGLDELSLGTPESYAAVPRTACLCSCRTRSPRPSASASVSPARR